MRFCVSNNSVNDMSRALRQHIFGSIHASLVETRSYADERLRYPIDDSVRGAVWDELYEQLVDKLE